MTQSNSDRMRNSVGVLKLIAKIVGKLVVVYLLSIFVLLDLVLIDLAVPRILFVAEPFIQAAAILMLVGVIASIVARSPSQTLWATFFVGYSLLFLIPVRELDWVIGLVCLVGAISYLYRNKATEPFLVLLPIISGGWLFVELIYEPYLVAWTSYIADGHMIEAVKKGLHFISIGGFANVLIVLPLLATYALGKQAYVDLYDLYRSRHRVSGK